MNRDHPTRGIGAIDIIVGLFVGTLAGTLTFFMFPHEDAHVDRIHELAERIEALPHYSGEASGERRWPRRLTGFTMACRRCATSQGEAADIAGWAAEMWGDDALGATALVSEIGRPEPGQHGQGQAALGLTDKQAAGLFGEAVPDDALDLVTPRMAASVLRAFASGTSAKTAWEDEFLREFGPGGAVLPNSGPDAHPPEDGGP